MAKAEDGLSVKALEKRPLLLPGLDVYYKGYGELCHDRPVGMSIGSIPWSSIIKWCHVNAIHDIDDIGTCIRYIRAMERKDSEITDKKEPKT